MELAKGIRAKAVGHAFCALANLSAEIFGSSPFTTNNRMELAGAIEGLKRLKETCSVEIVTDSEYLRNGMTSWINGWKRNGWKTSTKKPVTNKDLWMILDELVNAHKIQWVWTKGHANHEDNNRCDELASRAAELQLKSEPDPKGDIYRKHVD